VGRVRSAGIATRYRLDGPRIESRWGARFSAPVQTGPEAYRAFYTISTASFVEVKWSGLGVDHPPPSSAEVKERVELYLGFDACSRVSFDFTFTLYRYIKNSYHIYVIANTVPAP